MRNGSSGAVNQQDGAVYTRDTYTHTRWQIGTAHFPLTISQPDDAGTIVDGLLQNQSLPNVLGTQAMRGSRTAQFALPTAVLQPEIGADYDGGKKQKPGHCVNIC